MDEMFLEGVEEVRDVLNVGLVKDAPGGPNCETATIITKQSIECGDKLIKYGSASKGPSLRVDADRGALLKEALAVAYARKAGRIAVVQMEGSSEMVAFDAKAYVPIQTNPQRVLEDIFRVSQNRVLDAFVIMDPLLMFDRRKVDNSKLIIACGFKDDGADINVHYDTKEQGYLTGVLAYNIRKGRRLFKDRNVVTKIYITDNKKK
jgi:hypothetical protein